MNAPIEPMDDFGFGLDKDEYLDIPSLLEVHRASTPDGQTYYLLANQFNGKFLTRGEIIELGEVLQSTIDHLSSNQIAQAERIRNERVTAQWIKDQATQRQETPPRKPKNGFVYIAKAERYTKIGMSKTPIKRISMFDVQSPFDVNLVLLIPSDNMDLTEAELHERFSHRRVRGEWFDLSTDEIASIAEHYPTVDLSTLNNHRHSHFLASKGGVA